VQFLFVNIFLYFMSNINFNIYVSLNFSPTIVKIQRSKFLATILTISFSNRKYFFLVPKIFFSTPKIIYHKKRINIFLPIKKFLFCNKTFFSCQINRTIILSNIFFICIKKINKEKTSKAPALIRIIE
jgi:hypothetical protein